MLLSMTGFGEGRSESDTIVVTVEVRSVNNRHLKINYRSGDAYHALEPRVESLIREHIRRGAVMASLRVERRSAASDYQLNTEVLAGYREQLAQLDPDAASTPTSALLALPGVVIPPSDSDANPEADWPIIREALKRALDSLEAMRRHEGKALAEDLLSNCKLVAAELTGVEDRSPLVCEDYRQRLNERVSQSLEKLGVSIEPSDLVREVALFVDRSDISEETVRLRSHIEQFEATIASADSEAGRKDGAGRKLEFIAQEMGREVNTIGSKANDTEISRRVVEIKAALERVREQVQNVE